MVLHSDHDARGIHARIGPSESGDDAVASPLGWSQVHKQNLIFIAMNDAGQFGAQQQEVGLTELAFEHRVLYVVSVTSHYFEDLAQPFVVRDIVTDQVGSSHKIT